MPRPGARRCSGARADPASGTRWPWIHAAARSIPPRAAPVAIGTSTARLAVERTKPRAGFEGPPTPRGSGARQIERVQAEPLEVARLAGAERRAEPDHHGDRAAPR